MKLIGLPFRLLSLALKLAFTPLKVMQAGITFVTCVIPLLIVVGIAVLLVWFFIIR